MQMVNGYVLPASRLCTSCLLIRSQVFAEVVGGLSAITAILYLIPFILRFAVVWVWNLVLFILWIALFGLFGSVRLLAWSHGSFIVGL
jgi:hypothetical protein